MAILFFGHKKETINSYVEIYDDYLGGNGICHAEGVTRQIYTVRYKIIHVVDQVSSAIIDGTGIQSKKGGSRASL